MRDRRTEADRAYDYYRRAALKAGEHDDHQQLSRGLSVAKDIFCAETWRILCEQILTPENKDQSNRGMTLLHCQPTTQSQIDKAKTERPAVPVVPIAAAKRGPVVPGKNSGDVVVRFLNHKEIYARRNSKHRAAAA